jgi:ABC-2 type transport system permease protein
MRNSIAIAKKELNIYFATPIAYVMFTLFVLIGSYFFWSLVGRYEQISLMYMRFNSPEMVNRLNFQDAIFGPLFGNLAVILIFLMPLLTMRLIAEEKSSRTIELLYTSPLAPRDIVFGKFLGALCVVTCALLLTLIYPGIVQLIAKDTAGVEWRTVLLGYLGIWLLGAAYLALGMFFSALTDSQAIAALLGFVLALLTWIIGWAAGQAEGTAREIVSYLAATGHLEAFGRGTLELKDIIYFLTLIILGLFATHRAVEAHRWS